MLSYLSKVHIFDESFFSTFFQTITDVDDILTQLEENQLTLQTMLGSRYVAPIQDEVKVCI